MPSVSLVLVLCAIVLLALPSTAWAYIDPGTGSYLFQMVIAGGLAAAYTMRGYWSTIRAWFSREKSQ